MKIHSDILTTDDLWAALPKGVTMDCVPMKSPRKRERGWHVHLSGSSTYRTNSGQYGSGEEQSATWDQHGVWMDRLYTKDPDACIAWYTGRHHFYEATRQQATWRQRSRFRTVREGSTAPWLEGVVNA